MSNSLKVPPSRDLRFEYIAVNELKPYPGNARKHPKKQIRGIAESIKTLGFNSPLIVNEGNRVLAGHGRLEAAKLLGLEEVPITRVMGLSDTQQRAFALADNKHALNSNWDSQKLAIEIKSLLNITDSGFDITATGFAMGEVDVVIGEAEDPRPASLDKVPAIDRTQPPISRNGDLWGIGENRLLCGDARSPSAYSLLLGTNTAQLIFADPPYNVKVSGHARGGGQVHHEEFAMASGEMSEADFVAFLQLVLTTLTSISINGAIFFVCMSWGHLFELLSAARASGLELKNLCAWIKGRAGMGSLYRSGHELIAVLKSGRAAHTNNIELGRFGRDRSNVWSYPGFNVLQAGQTGVLNAHPTIKPVALVEDAILDCSDRGAVVVDPFTGSGTTLIAAQRTGRRGFGIELDPYYVDLALTRFRDAFKIEPVHLETGETFSDLQRCGRPYPQGEGKR